MKLDNQMHNGLKFDIFKKEKSSLEWPDGQQAGPLTSLAAEVMRKFDDWLLCFVVYTVISLASLMVNWNSKYDKISLGGHSKGGDIWKWPEDRDGEQEMCVGQQIFNFFVVL